MSTFDDLKYIVDDFRDAYGDFTTLNQYNTPGGKTGNHEIFTAREAISLFNEQLHTLESALEDKERCVRYVPETDMRLMIDLLTSAKRYIDIRDYHDFTTCIEEMISPVRSFAMLFMKNNEKEHTERIEKQNDSVSAQKLSDSFEQKEKRIGSIWMRVFWISSALIALAVAGWLGWDIAEIYLNPDAMKIVMNAFFILLAVGVAYFTIRQYLVTKKQNELIKKTDEFIYTQELSASLEEIEKRIGNIWIKRFWICLALGILAVAGCLGWNIAEIYRNLSTNSDTTELILLVISRSFLMLIAVSAAAFAARQYSKNKSIELDYAYKVALVRSYPGLAREFKKAGDRTRVEFTTKLMDEILQDPQRNRYKSDFLHPLNLLRKEQKVPEQTESSTSENKL